MDSSVSVACAETYDRRDHLQTDVAIKFWQRLIFSAVLEACKCEDGQPTSLAILQAYWIEDKRLPGDCLYPFSFDEACRNLGQNPDPARIRAMRKIKRAWRLKAVRHWQSRYESNRLRTFLVAGVSQQPRRQGVLGLVEADDYDEVAGIVEPSPRDAGHKPRAKMMSVPS